MISYQVPAYRPAPTVQQYLAQRTQPQQLGSLASMSFGDWVLGVGGTVVSVAGVKNLVRDLKGKPNVIDVALDVTVLAVGVTVFLQKAGKLLSA